MQRAQESIDFKAFYRELEKALSIKYHDMLQMESVQTWFDSFLTSRSSGLTVSSGIKYVPALFEFCGFVGEDPDTILAEARKSLRDPDTLYKFPHKMTGWFKDLNSRGLRWNTSVKKLSIVKSFFNRNEVKLDYKLPELKEALEPFAPEKPLLRDAFLSLERESPYRSWILFQSQSGLSEIDILGLDVDRENKDKYMGPVFDSIRSQIEAKSKCLQIIIPRQKTHEMTVTFLGEEAVSLLRFYDCKMFPWKSPSAVVKRFEKFQNIFSEIRFTAHTYSAPPVQKMQEEYERAYPALRLFEEKHLDKLGTLTRASI